MDDIPQPGSLEAEAGVFCSTFDQTGTRLITGSADKTIKVGVYFCCRTEIDILLIDLRGTNSMIVCSIVVVS